MYKTCCRYKTLCHKSNEEHTHRTHPVVKQYMVNSKNLNTVFDKYTISSHAKQPKTENIYIYINIDKNWTEYKILTYDTHTRYLVTYSTMKFGITHEKE